MIYKCLIKGAIVSVFSYATFCDQNSVELRPVHPLASFGIWQASVSSKWKLVVDFSSQRIPVAERRAVIAACAGVQVKDLMLCFEA